MIEADLQYEDTLKRSELRKFTSSVKRGHEPNLMTKGTQQCLKLKKRSKIEVNYHLCLHDAMR